MDPVAKQRDESSELDKVFTREAYRAYAEAEARSLVNTSFADALDRLDRGELAGTLAEARLKLIRSLLP
jgi:hypothetical protein